MKISEHESPGRSWTRPSKRWLAGFAAAAIFLAPTSALADDYDDEEAGHPLRIVGYVLHPVGVILDYLIFRPAYFIGSFEPLKTLVGQEDK